MKLSAHAPSALLLLCSACAGGETASINTTEKALAAAIVSACPMSATNDNAARIACAEALTKIDVLRDSLTDPMLWGGQPKDMPLEKVVDDASLTDFNPFVWRKMYLSTFMFDGEPTFEVAGEYRVLRMPVHFRNSLEPGEYPYPFWHSEKKWASYEQAIDLLLFFKDGKLVAATRSEEVDASRPHNARMWDGNWIWEEGAEPKAALYPFLFSPANPHVERLETAYRDFSDALRRQSCMTCHSPDNSAKMQHLELLNYPNQALTGRHDVVRVLEENIMPPDQGLPDMVVRLDLIRLATEFAEAGDEALEFEGEVVQ